MKTKLFFLAGFFFLLTATLQAQTAEFWGITSEGGTHNAGCIFKTDTTGQNQGVVYSWFKYEGSMPTYTRLCEADNGKLYGMTQLGGINNNGILFEYDPATSAYTPKILFDGPERGRTPNGSLIQATDMKLYGMTKNGGVNSQGIIFHYDPVTDTFTKLFDFDENNSGIRPYASLVQADNGKMYGTTSEGGAHNFGTLFEFDPVTLAFTNLLDFDGANNGEFPSGSLIQANDGYLYGTTFRGGANSVGVLFRYDPATDSYTKVMDFTTDEGSNPRGLMQADNGIIYGMTRYGGNSNGGALFQFDPATDTYTKKVDFDNNTGTAPRGVLLQDANGKLYGLTYTGGENSDGTLFEFDPATDTFLKKMDFERGAKGSNPMSSLIEASNGKFYGMTYRGGASNSGVLFDYEPETNSYLKILDFNKAPMGKDPYGSLLQAGNGKLYGTTEQGGLYNAGVLFAFDPINSVYSVLFDFDGEENGGDPYNTLIQADNGLLYSMTPEDGVYGYGILYSFDPATSTFTKLLDFDNEHTGSYPYASLLEADNGKLYGLTYEGGTYGFGTLFEYDPEANLFTKLVDFDKDNTGGYPYAGLIQADNGKLYGTTPNGGVHSSGVLFEFDPETTTLSLKYEFNSEDDGGIYPLGSLIQHANGKLYGMTSNGGLNGAGTLFEFDLVSGIFEEKFDFERTASGATPNGSLLQGENGKLYGMTSEGGVNDVGVLFEYDPATNILIKTLDFDRDNGAKPYGSLIRVSLIVNKVSEPSFTQNIRVYPVPVKDALHLDLGEDFHHLHLSLRSSDGKLLQDYGTPKDKQATIWITESSGLYFLEISSQKEKAVYKIIKQ